MSAVMGTNLKTRLWDSQGCPLSPFFFSMVMTCLLHDAEINVKARFTNLRAGVAMTKSILYADDIFLIETSTEFA